MTGTQVSTTHGNSTDWLHNGRLDYRTPFGLKAGAELTYYRSPSDQLLHSRMQDEELDFYTEDCQRINRWKFFLAQEHSLGKGWDLNYGAIYTTSIANSYQYYYDPETGEVRKRQTAQGYADESAWARGQAWALYGYTMCYRYTHDAKYLEQAEKVYNFIFNNKNLPEDLVPYWDFDAPNIPNEPRDASAAACTASALYELSTYLPDKGYKETADRIMESLASPSYRAKVGTNGNFILMHSVGSIPHGAEIDVPLNYADYYFLEGLMRKRDLEK